MTTAHGWIPSMEHMKLEVSSSKGLERVPSVAIALASHLSLNFCGSIRGANK